MKYTLLKRKKSYTSQSDEDFVRWMRKQDSQPWSDNEAFMEGYAYRKMVFEKIVIRHDTVPNFVEDLKKNNLLKVESSKGLFSYFSRNQ